MEETRLMAQGSKHKAQYGKSKHPFFYVIDNYIYSE